MPVQQRETVCGLLNIQKVFSDSVRPEQGFCKKVGSVALCMGCEMFYPA